MEFLIKNPVFTLGEFKQWLRKRGTNGSRAAESLLFYYVKSGQVIRIRRSLYAVVPQGSDSKRFVPDPFLLASSMSQGSVLVYHTALELQGRAYSIFNNFIYQAQLSFHVFSYRNWKFQPIRVPVALQNKGQENFGVITVDRSGMDVRVTSLERTLVDVLDRPIYSGSWEEVWHSLESIEFFDLDKVIEYVELLEKATTAAKVGFFLEQHRDTLMVEDKYLKAIKKLCPVKPHYFDRKARNGKLVKEWNLIVPQEVLDKSWEEVL